MRLLAVTMSIGLDTSVAAAPAGHCSESLAQLSTRRPVVEYDRWPERPPGDAVHGQRTTWKSDVLAKGEEEVVPIQTAIEQPGLQPQLCVARIVVQVDLDARAAFELAARQVAADIQKQICGVGARNELIRQLPIDQRAIDLELRAHPFEVVALRSRRAGELFYEHHGETESPQPKGNGDARPCMAAVAGFGSERASDNRYGSRAAHDAILSRSAVRTRSDPNSASAISRAARA